MTALNVSAIASFLADTYSPALVISLASLIISIATSWINLRRGVVRLSPPRRIMLFPKSIQAALVLSSSGTRGRIVEELVLIMDAPEGASILREWTHSTASAGYFQRVSLFVPFTGYIANHNWFFDWKETKQVYRPGDYKIQIFDVTSSNCLRRNGRKLLLAKAYIPVEIADQMNAQEPLVEDEDAGHIELDWNYRIRRFEVYYRPRLGE